MGDVLRRRRPGRPVPAVRRASTSRPTTSTGRIIGSECGKEAWALAQRYYDGTRSIVTDRARAARRRDRRPCVAACSSLVVASRGARAAGQRPSSAVAPGAQRRAAGPPRFVDETARARASPSSFDGPDLYARRGRGGRLRLRRRRPPDLYSAGGQRPAALYRNRVRRSGARSGSTAVPSATTDLTDVDRRLPDRHRRRRQRRTSRPARSARASCSAASATAASSAANEALGVRRRHRPRDRLQRHLGGVAALPTLAFGRYLHARRHGEATFDCDDERALRPSAGGTPDTAADRACARATARSRCCSATGIGSGRRDLRVSNDRHYYPAENGAGAAVADRARRSRPRLYTAADGWASAPDRGDGHRQLRPDRRRLPRGVPHQPGRQPAPDAHLPGRRSRRTATSALKRGVDRTRPVHRRRRACPRPRGTRSSRTSTTTASWTCSSRRATSTSQPGLRGHGPEQPVPRPARRDIRRGGRSRPASLSFDRGRGAALADFNLDGLLDLVEVNYGADRLWRNVGQGRPPRRPRWATG